MQWRALGLVVDVVAATADEAAPGWSQSAARYRFGRERAVARRGDGVADGERAALASDEIDAEVLVAKGGTQRARNVRSRWPVTGLTFVAPQRPFFRSTENVTPPIRMSRPTQSNSSQGRAPSM